MKRKLFVSLLMAILLLCIFTISASAESGTCGDNVTWELSADGVLTISGTGDMTDYTLLTRLWSKQQASITKIVIHDGVTSIGDYSFYDFTALQDVTIPGSVTRIGADAFSGCESLPSVTIPESVTRIDSSAFSGCDALSSVSIPDSVVDMGGSVFYGCSGLTDVTYSKGLTSIPDSTFGCCDSLLTFEVPQWVTSIGDYAFSNCEELQTISIHAGVTSIGFRALNQTPSLTAIELAEDHPVYSTDESGALFNKDKTELIAFLSTFSGDYTVPDGVTLIHDYAFQSCTGLTGVHIPSCVETIGEWAFNDCVNMARLTLSEGLVNIGTSAFWGCTGLTELTIPGTVATIPQNAFLECKNLESITLSEGIQRIENYAFGYAYKITRIDIPDSVTDLSCSALVCCIDLEYLSLPGKLESVTGSLENCESLRYVQFRGNPPAEYEELFIKGRMCNEVSVQVFYPFDDPLWTAEVRDAFGSDAVWFTYGDEEARGVIAEGSNHETIRWQFTRDGVLTFRGEGDMYGWELGDSNWPAEYDEQVRTVVIESGIDVVADMMIGEAPNLTTIMLPDTLEFFSVDVVWYFPNLQKYVIDEDNPYLCSDEYGVRYSKDKTVLYGAPAGMTGSYTVPETVTSIGDEGFVPCHSLTEVIFQTDPPQNLIYGVWGRGQEDSLLTVYYPADNPNWTDDIVGQSFTNVKWMARYEVDETAATQEGLTLHTGGEYELFESAAIDGQIVDSSNYTVTQGSTIITFDSGFVRTLDKGAHTVTLNYTDGTQITRDVYITEAPRTVTTPDIQLAYPTLTFEDVILMNVYYSASNLEDVAEMGMITYSESVTDYSVETAETVIPGYAWSEEDGFYYSTTEGIPAKCLGDTIYFAVYYKLSDGTYGYTDLVGYSPKTYAYNQLKTGSSEMKTLVAAMLNYGAAAQNYFSYKTDALVNANLTDEQKALVADYSDSMIDTVIQASGDKPGIFVSNGGHNKFYPTISFEGAFCINYYFQPKYTVSGDVTLYIWSLEDFNAATSLTKENATRTITMTLTESGEYLAVVDGIAAKDLDKAVYVSVSYESESTEYFYGVIGYTIGMYCKTQATKTGTLADLAAATAVYGYCAKELFY